MTERANTRMESTRIAAAKKDVTKYLSEWFGWKTENIIDLGDITAARGTEMMMPFWMRLFQRVIGHPHFNYRIVRGHDVAGDTLNR